jgi:hypothetical protein
MKSRSSNSLLLRKSLVSSEEVKDQQSEISAIASVDEIVDLEDMSYTKNLLKDMSMLVQGKILIAED